VLHREVTLASDFARSEIRQGPNRLAIEEGTARIAGRMNKRTSVSEIPESQLNCHPCASRGRLDCIAPHFDIR
jgi:hypothetical protein